MTYVQPADRPSGPIEGRDVAASFMIPLSYYDGDGEQQEIWDYLHDHFVDLSDEDGTDHSMVSVVSREDGSMQVHVHAGEDVDRVRKVLGELTDGGW